MADNDQNDEYKFTELDSLDNDSMEHEYVAGDQSSSIEEPKPHKKDVKRNALIVVGLVILVMVLYKLIGGFFSGKSTTEAKGNIPAAPVASEPMPQTQPVHSELVPSPIEQVQPAVREDNSILRQKVDSIESNQQNVQSQVSSMNEQVGNVNNNVSNLTAQIDKLNQTLNDLTSQLSRQSAEINLLMERTKPKPIKRIIRPFRQGQVNIYYINAVIPGRAWLIGTNGSTLTVREGTKITGYGVVKLIDPMEGRVLTSSGRIIQFSQEDS